MDIGIGLNITQLNKLGVFQEACNIKNIDPHHFRNGIINRDVIFYFNKNELEVLHIEHILTNQK